jgi:CRP/FNR family transcriptional regulator
MRPDEKRPLLLAHPLMEGVDPHASAPVLEAIPVKDVRAGMLLNTPGISDRLMHLVLKGRLRAYQVTADGRELLLELIQEGGFDGVLSVAGRRGHFTAADADSTVASLNAQTLERLVSIQPRVATNLLELIVGRLEAREVHLETIALHDPTRRIARQLLALSKSFGSGAGDVVVLRPRITHQMLADMLGVRRETVTLHLGKMADIGAVVVRGGHLHLDVERLRRIAEQPEVQSRAG